MAKQIKKEKPAHLIARAKSKFETYTVKEQAELMDFLMKAKSGISRTTAKSLLSKRQVYVNNTITTQYNFPLKPGMKVQISKEKGKKEFHNNHLKIVYEDAYLLIINKNEGLLTIGTEKQKEQSAYSILMEYVKRSGKQHRVFIVNKLDKETSGLLFFAKDEKTRNSIQDYWHEIVKEYKYVAILSGNLEKDSGTVASWMVEDKVYVSHTSVPGRSGDKAITNYKTIKRANGYSLVELSSENGRRNLMRLHMQELKHSIVGDIKFGDEENNPIDRLALHAFKLRFFHPVTEELLAFETPYPSAFKKLLIKQEEKQA